MTRNGTLDLLKDASDSGGFRILAVVLTHFDFDHYAGLVDVLDRFAGLKEGESPRLELTTKSGKCADVGSLVVPAHYQELLTDYERWKAARDGGAYERQPGRRSTSRNRILTRFLDYVRAFKEAGQLDYLDQFSPVWSEPEATSNERGRTLRATYWMVSFGPRLDDRIRQSVRDLLTYQLTGTNPLHRHRKENEFSYVLGFGCGARAGDPHILLTADASPMLLRRIYANIELRLLSALERLPVTDWSLPGIADPRLFVRRKVEDKQLPNGDYEVVQRLFLAPPVLMTMPHHGADSSSLSECELRDWFRERTATFPNCPTVAIVQGVGRDLVKPVKPMLARGMRIFASAPPAGGRRRTKNRVRSILDEDLPSGMHQYHPPSPAEFEIQGGPGGITMMESRGFVEVVGIVGDSATYIADEGSKLIFSVSEA